MPTIPISRRSLAHLVVALRLILAPPSSVALAASELFEQQNLHDSYPTGLSFLRLGDKRWLATTAWDGWLKLWDADTGAAGPAVRLSERRLHHLVVTTFGLAVVAGDDGLFVYDLTARRLINHLLSGVALREVIAHPSLPLVFAADATGKVFGLDLVSRQVLATWSTLGRTLTFFGVTQDGETLITTDTKVARLWSTATGELLKTYRPLGPNEPIAAVAFNSTSGVLYIGSGKRVAAVDVATGHTAASLTVSSSALVGLASGATPGKLLVASRGGEVKLWDFDRACAIVALASEDDEGYSQWTFSADQRRAYALMPVISRLKGWNLEPVDDECSAPSPALNNLVLPFSNAKSLR